MHGCTLCTLCITSPSCYRLRNDGSNLIKDRKYHLTTYKQAFVGREFVDWLISRGEASSRIEAVEIGKQLLDAGVFRHGTYIHVHVTIKRSLTHHPSFQGWALKCPVNPVHFVFVFYGCSSLGLDSLIFSLPLRLS